MASVEFNGLIEVLNIRRYPTQTCERAISEMTDIVMALGSLGVANVDKSRIGQYRRVFETLRAKALKRETLTLPEARTLIHGKVEYAQLRMIVRAVQSSSNRPEWIRQLGKLVSGKVIPDEKDTQSSARDFQFELFLAAVSELSGYAVAFEEPDLVVRLGDQKFGVAAKRPRSLESLNANCRKAARQIQTTNRTGLVALDISFAQGGKCIHTNSRLGAVAAAEHLANAIMTDRFWDFTKFRAKGVIAFLVNLQLPYIGHGSAGTLELGSVTRWTVASLMDPSDPRLAWLLHYARACERSLFGDAMPDETPDLN